MNAVSFPLVVAGALIGLGLVMIFKPEISKQGVADGLMQDKRLQIVERRSIGELMAAFEAADSASERVKISAEFRGLSSSGFAEALEKSGYRDDSSRLNEAATCLLIAWAEKDARAALAWSWDRLKGSGKWEKAFAEIIETWVANDPVAVIAFYGETQRINESLEFHQAKGSEAIILDEETLEILSWAFYARESAIALMALQQGVGLPRSTSSGVTEFSDFLNSVEEVEAALRSWKDVEGGYMAIYSLENRLKQLRPPEPLNVEADWKPEYMGLKLPADFKGGPVSQRWNRQQLAWKGARIDFERTVAEAQSLPAGEREAVFLAIYDSWHTAHPGEEPDPGLLPEDARELWQDLDGLGPVNDSFSSNQWKSKEFLKE